MGRDSNIGFDRITIKTKNGDYTANVLEDGYTKILKLPICIMVEKEYFLHIGAAYDPRSTIKGQIFKIDGLPVIPATSFKGALRFQLECYIINELKGKLKDIFKIENENEKYWKPCIPTTQISKAERKLIRLEGYRAQFTDKENRKYSTCYFNAENIDYPQDGICPVCYFMGASGLPGFLRFTNFITPNLNSIVYQTNIRLDRKTCTAASGAKVEQEQVKGGTIFKGNIEIVLENTIDRLQGVTFGTARTININERTNEEILDKWLYDWEETDRQKRIETLVNEMLVPAILNIKTLGGYKNRGAGNVSVYIA